METIILHENRVPNRRLGRHVRHDPRSWQHPAAMAGHLVSIRHERHVPIFDQGGLGSCTGNAAVGCISSGPFTFRGTEDDAVSVYSDATKIDEFAGTYPPNDTGSSGLAVMKVLHKRGLIPGYTHAFDLYAVLRALVLRPGIVGMTWKTGCDSPNAEGVIRYQGAVRGGHEVCIDELNVEKKLAGFQQSWGPTWGLQGRFYMTWDDLGKALSDYGDATFPLPPI